MTDNASPLVRLGAKKNKRRALAFDLAGASTYDTMAAYHAGLMDHRHLPAPPGYTPVSVYQILGKTEQLSSSCQRK